MVSSFAHTTWTLCRVPPENQCYFSTVFLEGCQPWGGDLASICGVWNFFRILTICNHVFVFKLWGLPQEFLSLSFILFTNPSLTYFNLLNSVYYSFVPNGTGHQILVWILNFDSTQDNICTTEIQEAPTNLWLSYMKSRQLIFDVETKEVKYCF